jgi:hypothetical protein
MAKIEIKKTGDCDFKVSVVDGKRPTFHTVRVEVGFSKRMFSNPEKLVKETFLFLLEHEPKEAILSSFDIPETVIRYFPNFERELRSRLK